MLILILPFFQIFIFSFFHSYIIHMDIFSVKDFSATTSVRILKFGTKLDSDKLYCVTKEQPHIAYQSLYLFIFLSRERSGSVVECLTRDRGAAGSSLTGVTALCP